MTAMVEFEAVARLSSFTLAAQELGVSQAAVSKQVKYLEETLGTRLFHRLHRAIKLTSDGYLLYSVVACSMQRMASVFDNISEGIPEPHRDREAPFAKARQPSIRDLCTQPICASEPSE